MSRETPSPAPAGAPRTPPGTAGGRSGGRLFRRGLLYFSVVFAVLLLADVAVVGHLIFRDLSRRVVEEARVRSLEEARALAASLDLAPASDMASPAAVYRMVRDTYAVARYAERALSRYTFIERIRVFNDRGQQVMPAHFRRADIARTAGEGQPAGEPPSPGPPAEPLPPGPPAARDPEGLPNTPRAVNPELPGPQAPDETPPGASVPIRPAPRGRGGARPDPATLALYRMQGIPLPALSVGPGHPSDFSQVRGRRTVEPVVVQTPTGSGRVEIALDEEVLRAEIEQLRRDLILKILIGAGLSLVLIVVAYVFVVKLFNKTRRLETEAQMADRLAYVGTLAAGLAHEIRNPLSAMKLNLQMLEAGMHEPDDESRDLLQETQHEVERLGGLVTSFLSYARPARLELAAADLNEVVSETVGFMRPDAERRAVRIDLEAAPGLPAVQLDRKQVRQAILNIVHNAVAAVESDGGGQVQVRTGSDNSHGARVEIEDDGPGIPGDRLDSIFQVFYSSKPGGTGLGLPIAQRIMEGHGGRIQVESRPGAGTRFTLYFPPGAVRPDKAAS